MKIAIKISNKLDNSPQNNRHNITIQNISARGDRKNFFAAMKQLSLLVRLIKLSFHLTEGFACDGRGCSAIGGG